MSKLPVKAVIFDLWGTLIYNIPRTTNFHELIEMVGVPPEILWNSWRSYTDASLRGQIRSGLERAQLTLKELALPTEKIEQIAPALAKFEQQSRASQVHFYPGVEQMLDDLKNTGYIIGLISNCSYLTPSIVDEIGIRKKIDLTILSCEVGLVKPEVEIYLQAATRLKVNASECLFVGDGGDNEMIGAKLAGFITALVEQERGHAYRYPEKDYVVDYRLPTITAVLDYLKFASLD
jgi:putative hydrolase of the HAD superfamily